MSAAPPPALAAGDEVELSALVSARLCHDLVSPLGAIGNGLELMEMAGAGRGGAEVALISDSLGNALGKLRFLRIAFGPADPGARQSCEEAAGIAAAAFPGRFSVAWEAAGRDIARPIVRAVHLAILCLEKSLPLGGEVRVEGDDGGVALAVEGRRTAPPAELWSHVLDGAPLAAVTSDTVQFALLRRWLDRDGGTLAARFEEAGAWLRLTPARAA